MPGSTTAEMREAVEMEATRRGFVGQETVEVAGLVEEPRSRSERIPSLFGICRA